MNQLLPPEELRARFDAGYAIRFRIVEPAENARYKEFVARLVKERVHYSKAIDVTDQAVLVFKPSEA